MVADTVTGDHVLRAITDDNNFRVMVVSTTLTLAEAIAKQAVTGPSADRFGEFLTGIVLVRETMSPYHRVQGILNGVEGSGSLVIDTHPDGKTRGLVQRGSEEFSLGDGSVLQVMRSMAKGVHRSVVKPPDDGGVAAALMTYMQESEQIISVIATGVLWRDDALVQAGGYVIQLLPGAARGPLMVMTERLESLPPVAEMLDQMGGSPRALLDELLYGMPYAQLDDRPVLYGCQCDRQAVVASLASLSRDELAELLTGQEVLELTCDYCNTEYSLGRQHLEGLLRSS